MIIKIVFITILIIVTAVYSINQNNDYEGLKIIKEALIKSNIGSNWEIKTYELGKILMGDVLFDLSRRTWNRAGVIICNKNISDIKKKLIQLSMSAPFKILDYSKRFQILSWASKEYSAIQKVIEIVKKADK